MVEDHEAEQRKARQFVELSLQRGDRNLSQDVERIDDQGIAAWDGHNADAFAGLLADDFVWTDLTLPEPMRTKDQARQYTEAWFTAFPDMSLRRTYRVVGNQGLGIVRE